MTRVEAWMAICICMVYCELNYEENLVVMR